MGAGYSTAFRSKGGGVLHFGVSAGPWCVSQIFPSFLSGVVEEEGGMERGMNADRWRTRGGH